jgi:hypothetical protein
MLHRQQFANFSMKQFSESACLFFFFLEKTQEKLIFPTTKKTGCLRKESFKEVQPNAALPLFHITAMLC